MDRFLKKGGIYEKNNDTYQRFTLTRKKA